MKKKLVHIVEAFGGGIYSVLADLINNTTNDYDIIVLYGERPETPINFKKDFDDSVNFIKINNFTRSINIKKDLKAIKEVKEKIKEIEPDIVHLHSSKAGIIGRLALIGKKARLLYNPHGFSFLKQDDSKIKRITYWWIEKIAAILNRRCTIVGCSNGEYKEAKKLSKNSICINNGIDINKIKSFTKSLKEKEIDFKNLKVCTVGRIGYQKNPKLFNEIAQALPDIQFTWIGDGEQRDLLSSKNITITGWKNKKEVLQILNSNDIFLLVSLWEGLPIALLEAMYMKKVCIVSDVVGNRDVIKNDENGFICSELNGYIETINKLKSSSRVNIEFIDNEYKDILEIYNIDRMIEEYRGIYEK